MGLQLPAAHGLAGLRPANLQHVAPGGFTAEVVVKTDHPVHLGPGQAQGAGDCGYRAGGNAAQRFLHRVQQGQQPPRHLPEAGDVSGDQFVAGPAVRLFTAHRAHSPPVGRTSMRHLLL